MSSKMSAILKTLPVSTMAVCFLLAQRLLAFILILQRIAPENHNYIDLQITKDELETTFRRHQLQEEILRCNFMTTGTNDLAPFTKEEHRRQVSARTISHYFLTLNVLISWDIALNPGPNYKYPCGQCNKPVKRNQKGIQCDGCDLWLHTKCIEMPDESYFQLAESEQDWHCQRCLLPQFTDSFFLPIPDIAGDGNLSTESVFVLK